MGIGPTKTLAKLANHIAKTAERKPGNYPMDLAQIYNLAALPSSDLDALLRTTDVSEVWGVRPRIGKQLKEGEIQTVLDFVRMDPATVRRRWGVSLERTLRELPGQQCVELDSAPGPKKQIACTRSFGKPIHELPPLIEAASEFAGRAAEKLRAQDSAANEMLEFVHTSPPQGRSTAITQHRRAASETHRRYSRTGAGSG